jgi:hypothetical protein
MGAPRAFSWQNGSSVGSQDLLIAAIPLQLPRHQPFYAGSYTVGAVGTACGKKRGAMLAKTTSTG